MLVPGGVNEVDDEGWDGEDEHEGDEDLPHPGLGGDQLPGPVLGLAQEVVLRRLVRVLALKWEKGSQNIIVN